jgi:HEAT repeat protein
MTPTNRRTLIASGVLVLALGSASTHAQDSSADTGSTNRPSATPAAASDRAQMSDVEAAKLREDALELLVSAGMSGAPEVRVNAIEALGWAPARLKQVAPAALADSNVAVRAVAAMSIARARVCELTPQVEPLVNDESALVKSAAIFAMRRCNSGVDPSPLAGLLFGDPSPKVRAHVAFIIGELGDRSAISMLRDAARDPLPRANPSEVRILRLQLAEARVKLGDDSAVPEIRSALYPARPEDLEVTALAAQVMGETKDKGAMDQLIFITARRNEQGQPFPAEIRLAAAGSVAELGNSKGGFIAQEYVSNPAETLRAQAAYVLGQTGRPEHLPTLAGLMKDTDARVRVSAAWAVVRITQRMADQRATSR